MSFSSVLIESNLIAKMTTERGWNVRDHKEEDIESARVTDDHHCLCCQLYPHRQSVHPVCSLRVFYNILPMCAPVPPLRPQSRVMDERRIRFFFFGNCKDNKQTGSGWLSVRHKTEGVTGRVPLYSPSFAFPSAGRRHAFFFLSFLHPVPPYTSHQTDRHFRQTKKKNFQKKTKITERGRSRSTWLWARWIGFPLCLMQPNVHQTTPRLSGKLTPCHSSPSTPLQTSSIFDSHTTVRIFFCKKRIYWQRALN